MCCRRLIILSSPVAVVAQLGSTATNSTGSPNAGGTMTSQLLAFSRCVRSHGVPNFPDPQTGANNAMCGRTTYRAYDLTPNL